MDTPHPSYTFGLGSCVCAVRGQGENTALCGHVRGWGVGSREGARDRASSVQDVCGFDAGGH